MFIANGNGEASVVGPDDLDSGVGIALDGQLVAFASVGSLVFGAVLSFN